MEEKFNVNEIIKLEQLPKIFSQLEKLGLFIDDKVKDIDKLECTEENKKEVKKRRAEINNALKVLEDKRKEIKNGVLEEYKQFEDKYNIECKSKLENASEVLKEKIDFIENTQKKEKEDNLRIFFKAHQESNHLEDILNFEDLNLNITLSGSEQSYKEEIKSFVEKVSEEVKAINQEEFSGEILLEYKDNGFDYAKAKNTIIERKKAIEEFNKKITQNGEELRQEDLIIQNVESLISPPKEIEEDEDEPEITLSFKVTTTKSKLLKLKEFLNENKIKYE